VLNGIVILLAVFDRIRLVRTQRLETNPEKAGQESYEGRHDDRQ
jgi:hypothetical protein